MTTVLLFVIIVASNVIGNVFFKIGARSMPVLGSVPFVEFMKALANRWFFIGVLGFALSFPAFVMLLNRQKLSVVYPIVTAVTFISIALASVIWLKEDLSVIQFVGIFVIITGIALLVQS